MALYPRANASKINLLIDYYWIQEMPLFKSFCLKAGGLPQPLKGNVIKLRKKEDFNRKGRRAIYTEIRREGCLF